MASFDLKYVYSPPLLNPARSQMSWMVVRCTPARAKQAAAA